MEINENLSRCDSCGGYIPEEGSECWEAATDPDGYCPRHVATEGGESIELCGAFPAGYNCFRSARS